MRIFRIKLWAASVALITITWIVISNINERLALDIGKSFWNGEASVGFWMQHGVPFWRSIAIGIACSTYDIYTWFCLFPMLKKLYPGNIKPVYERIYGEDMIVKNAETPWLIKAHRIGERVYRFLVPQPDRTGTIEGEARGQAHYYHPLFFYGIFPGSIFYGVSYVVAFELHTLISFAILMLANAAKIIFFGYLALVVNRWIIVAAVFLTPAVRVRIESYLREANARAPLFEEE